MNVMRTTLFFLNLRKINEILVTALEVESLNETKKKY